MKTKHLFVTLVTSLTFLLINSCTDDYVSYLDVNEEQNTPDTIVVLSQEEQMLFTELINKTPKISQKNAIEIANEFFYTKNSSTLSKKAMCTPQCEVVTRQSPQKSKSAKKSDVEDTLLFVFNFDEGYAIIPADVRVPEQVLAFSENGELHLDTDNPGVQLFINMAQDYVDLCITKAEANRDSIENTLTQKLIAANIIESDSTKNTLSKNLKADSRFVSSYSTTTYLETDVVKPLIKTHWKQGDPFNKYTPIVDGIHCPAGCVAIAFSQLMAYYQYPTSINGKYLNWTLLLSDNYDKENFKNSVSEYVHTVGTMLKTRYTTTGSYANTSDGITLLKQFGYSTNPLSTFSFINIKKSIDNNRPVIMVGYTSEKEGHAWLADGYAQKKFKVTQVSEYEVGNYNDRNSIYKPKLETITSTYYSTTNYIHYNWGWGNEHTNYGYYSENVFNNNNSFELNSKDELVNSRYTYSPQYDFKYSVQNAVNIYH